MTLTVSSNDDMNDPNLTQYDRDLTKNDPDSISRPILAMGCLALAVFFVVMYAVLTGQASGFDDPIRGFFYELRSDALNLPIIIFTNLSHWLVMVIMCIILLIIPGTRRHFGVPLSAGALATVLMNQVIKHLIQRPRPDAIQLVEETSYSFPSGHSVNSMFFYGLAIWLVWHYLPSSGRRTALMILLAIPMLLIGPTRIYLGVHYPTDVLAGWCLGCVAIVVIIEMILRREGREESDLKKYTTDND